MLYTYTCIPKPTPPNIPIYLKIYEQHNLNYFIYHKCAIECKKCNENKFYLFYQSKNICLFIGTLLFTQKKNIF